MVTKALIIAFLAACGVDFNATPPDDPIDQPDKAPPDEEVNEGQHFCCTSLDDGAGGDGCTLIGKEYIALCDKVLYCAGSWKKDGGKVTCIE